MEIRRVQVEGPDGRYGLSYADWASPARDAAARGRWSASTG